MRHRRRRGSRKWSPLDLGDDLREWWNADDVSRLVISGGQVSDWTSVKGLTLSQATSGAQPTWSATGFNGAPGVTFDGVDDVLSAVSALGRIPGTSGYYLLAVVDQVALPADATTRAILTLGTSNGSRRMLARGVVSGANRIRGIVDATDAYGTSGNFSGRKLVALHVGAAATDTYLDAVLDTSTAVAPAAHSARTRIGANQAGTGNFWNGKMRDVMAVRDTISAAQLAKLNAFLLARRMP